MSIIKYIPKLKEFTGSINSSLLLTQSLYWYDKVKGKPFFKFNSPCSSILYKKNDSWTEELGFSRHQFKTARQQIGTKILLGHTYSLHELNLLIFWRNHQNLTFYYPNFIRMLELSFENDVFETHFPSFANWKKAFTKVNVDHHEIQYTASAKVNFWQSLIQKTTSEKHTEDKSVIHKNLNRKGINKSSISHHEIFNKNAK